VFSLAVRNRIQLDFEAGRAVMVRGLEREKSNNKKGRKRQTLLESLTIRLKATNNK
jgi:hypothetical protein